MVFCAKLHGCLPNAPRLAPGEVRIDQGRVMVGSGDGLLELIEYTTPAGKPLISGEVLGW
jgi:hypothetical protein